MSRDDLLFIFAALAAPGTVFAALGAFYTMAAYYRAQASQAPSMSTATDSDTRPVPRVPRRTILLGSLSLTLFIATIFAIYQMRAPGLPDPRVDALSHVVNALAKAHRLQKELDELDRIFANYQQLTKDHLESFKKAQESVDRLGRTAAYLIANDAAVPVKDTENHIKMMVKVDLGVNLDLDKNPNFDKNHHIPTDGAENLNDPYLQEEYRRAVDLHRNSEMTISNAINQYRLEIGTNENEIFKFISRGSGKD